MRVKLEMKGAEQILREQGLGKGGDVQRFLTSEVNRRLGKYMPHRSGALETKLKYIRSDTEIEVLGPYAKYQYYGKAMEGQPPKVVTSRDLEYTKDFNPLAGPRWEKRMMAAEGEQLLRELKAYLARRDGK